MSYSATEMRICLQALGVATGDCLFIHSGLKSLGRFVAANEKPLPQALLEIFVDAIGPAGTLVVPTFNFAFCKGASFDRQNTPAEGMGAFSEFVRTCPGSLRSRHPFQSVAAVGAHADEIATAWGRSAFAGGSAFDVMLRLDCKILFFGVDFVETFVHVAEERALVPYRFWKAFCGTCIDEGVCANSCVEFYARKLDLVPEPHIDVPKIDRHLRARKLIRSARLGDGMVSICSGPAMVDELTEKFRVEPLFPLLSH